MNQVQGKAEIRRSREVEEATEKLRDFLLRRYISDQLPKGRRKAVRLVQELYRYYMKILRNISKYRSGRRKRTEDY